MEVQALRIGGYIGLVLQMDMVSLKEVLLVLLFLIKTAEWLVNFQEEALFVLILEAQIFTENFLKIGMEMEVQTLSLTLNLYLTLETQG